VLPHSSLISVMGKLLPNQQLSKRTAKNRGIGMFLNMHLRVSEERKKDGI